MSETVSGTTILREKEVLRRTGLPKATRTRLEKRGEFPLRLQLSETGKATGYSEAEIERWINSRRRGFRDQPLSIRVKTEAEA